MEIKPTGPGANPSPVSNNDQQVNKKAFPGQAEAPSAAGQTITQENLPLSSVLAEYGKADLQDPAKVENMLSQCAGTLLNDVLGHSDATLSADEKSYLTRCLQEDPSFRAGLKKCISSYFENR